MRAAWTLWLILPAALMISCASAPPKAPYPHESILTVIAELKIFLDQDPYRQPPGQDLNGRNIFRVSLERLEAIAGVANAEYADVLAFAKGECLERLGEWAKARAAFESAAGRKTSLAQPARRRAASAGRMAELTSHASPAPTLEGYLNDLQAAEQRLRSWLDSAPPRPTNAYLRQGIERLQEERAGLLFTNRLVLDKATRQALETAQKMTREHKESYRVMQHWLRLGSFYETLARDWTARHPPESANPQLEPGWLGWIEQARQAYRRVAQADGDPAKLEGQARLRALDAYALGVQAQAK